MITFKELFGNRNSINVFDTLHDQSLTVKEMNMVRGGGDPLPDPSGDPQDIIFPLP